MRSESKSRLIAATVTTVLVICMSAAIYYHSADNKHKAELKRELLLNDSLQAVKQMLDKDIAGFRTKLSEMEGVNSALSDRLIAANKLIDENNSLIEKLKKENNGVRSLKKQVKTLTDTKAQLQTLYNELQAENTKLKTENESIKKQLGTLTSEKMALDAQYAALAKATMSYSSDNFKIEVTKSNTDKLTNKAKKTKHLSVSFMLPQNPLFGTDTKKIYVSVMDAKGASVKSEKDEKVEIAADDKSTEILSVASKSIDFSKCPQNVSFDINVVEKLKQGGIYIIQVYTEDGIIGRSEFRLN